MAKSDLDPEAPRKQIIAIDPGDRYVGVAFFEEDPDEEWGWRCIDAQEFTPDEFADSLAETIVSDDPPYAVVYERWRLYGDLAQAQKGSEMETAQLIGIIKWLVRVHNLHVDRHEQAEAQGKLASCETPGGTCHTPPHRPKRVILHGQMADIKKPTRGILNKRKIKSVARGIATKEYKGRDHVVDAELHGWKYILDPPK